MLTVWTKGEMLCISVAALVLLTIPGLYGQAASTEGWTGVRMDNDRYVLGAQTLVDLTASNARRCLRMCWLFRACSALTFTLSQRRCQLFVLSGSDVGAYRLAVGTGNQSVDMRTAQIDTRLTTPRGCDKRPCSEIEMCAPVKDYAFYVCIELASEFCQADPPIVPHSTTEQDNVGSVVYTCVHGYFQTGTNHVSECNRHYRTWSEVDTVCSFVDCGAPPPVLGAISSGSSTSAGSLVTYNCLTGAVPSSAGMTSTCVGNTGIWSPIPEQCVAVSCGQPPPIAAMEFELVARSPHGAFPGLDADGLAVAYGGEALYACREGYTAPEGSRYISQCQADGMWSSTENFRCSPVDCGAPPTVGNASAANCSDTTFGHNATITCLPGFSPQESTTFTCNATGNWEGPEMTCEPTSCGQPPYVHFATLDHDSSAGPISTTAGSVVNYTCVAVAVPISAEMTSTCQGDLKLWYPIPPPCTPVHCRDPPTVDNMTYELTNRPKAVEEIPYMSRHDILRSYGGRANYTCNDGYTSPQDASFVSSCRVDGTWSSTADFLCSPLDCGQPPSIGNSTQLTATATTVGASVTVQCMPGFSPLGGTVLTCNATGDWEPAGVSCRLVDCGQPPSIGNSTQLTATATTVGASVNILCLHGFSTQEGTVLTCNATGDWEPTGVSCRPVDCGEPPPVNNATVNYTETSLGSKAHYACIQPSVSLGETNWTVTCLESDQWSNVSISCSPVPCGEAPRVSYSSVSYLLEGDLVKAKYTCDDGFRLEGHSTLTCDSLGGVISWSGSPVTCERISCGDAPEVPKANVFLTGTAYPYSALYKCQSGYVLSSGTSNRTCQVNGEWSTEVVTCSELKCETPALPQDAVFTTVIAADSTFNVGTELSFTCPNGFTIVPINSTLDSVKMSSVTCLIGQQWDTPNPEVLCVPDICGVPPSISSATWTLKAGSPYLATYRCVEGYTLAAAPTPTNRLDDQSSTATADLTSECTSLLGWDVPSTLAGGCFKVDCGEILTPDKLEVPMVHNTEFGSRVEASCTAPLYVNSPTNVMECQADGRWTVLDASDVCSSCNQSTHGSGIPQGLLELDVMSGPVADRAKFNCQDGFYALGAADELRCASVNNTASWQGLENARCIQTRWENPTKKHTEPTRYYVPVDEEACCSRGFRACAVVTFTGDNKMTLLLTDVGEEANTFDWVLHVEYLAQERTVSLSQYPYGTSEDTLFSSTPLQLIQEQETATFCIILDVQQLQYQFTKNSGLILQMPVKNSKFNRFAVKHSVSVSLIELDYQYSATATG